MANPPPPPLRTVFCTDCGSRLGVPQSLAVGRKVQCGRCRHVFEIPPEMPERSQTAEGPIDTFLAPRHLQAALEDDATQPDMVFEDDGPPFTEPSPPDVERLDAPPAGEEYDDKVRKAFDLDFAHAPVRRTGAGMINIADLDLPDED